MSWMATPSRSATSHQPPRNRKRPSGRRRWGRRGLQPLSSGGWCPERKEDRPVLFFKFFKRLDASMITDPIFYRLFETSPETFFLLLGMPADAASEMAARYQYQAIEFKETSH